MKIKEYLAKNTPVLNLSYTEDTQGEIIPPEAYITFSNPVPIIFNHEWDKVVGEAYLMRIGNQIVADLLMTSALDDESEAETMIKLMYPSIAGTVRDRHQNKVFVMDINAIAVTFQGNADLNIQKLGNRVQRLRKSIE